MSKQIIAILTVFTYLISATVPAREISFNQPHTMQFNLGAMPDMAPASWSKAVSQQTFEMSIPDTRPARVLPAISPTPFSLITRWSGILLRRLFNEVRLVLEIRAARLRALPQMVLIGSSFALSAVLAGAYGSLLMASGVHLPQLYGVFALVHLGLSAKSAFALAFAFAAMSVPFIILGMAGSGSDSNRSVDSTGAQEIEPLVMMAGVEAFISAMREALQIQQGNNGVVPVDKLGIQVAARQYFEGKITEGDQQTNITWRGKYLSGMFSFVRVGRLLIISESAFNAHGQAIEQALERVGFPLENLLPLRPFYREAHPKLFPAEVWPAAEALMDMPDLSKFDLEVMGPFNATLQKVYQALTGLRAHEPRLNRPFLLLADAACIAADHPQHQKLKRCMNSPRTQAVIITGVTQTEDLEVELEWASEAVTKGDRWYPVEEGPMTAAFSTYVLEKDGRGQYQAVEEDLGRSGFSLTFVRPEALTFNIRIKHGTEGVNAELSKTKFNQLVWCFRVVTGLPVEIIGKWLEMLIFRQIPLAIENSANASAISFLTLTVEQNMVHGQPEIVLSLMPPENVTGEQQKGSSTKENENSNIIAFEPFQRGRSNDSELLEDPWGFITQTMASVAVVDMLPYGWHAKAMDEKSDDAALLQLALAKVRGIEFRLENLIDVMGQEAQELSRQRVRVCVWLTDSDYSKDIARALRKSEGGLRLNGFRFSQAELLLMPLLLWLFDRFGIENVKIVHGVPDEFDLDSYNLHLQIDGGSGNLLAHGASKAATGEKLPALISLPDLSHVADGDFRPQDVYVMDSKRAGEIERVESFAARLAQYESFSLQDGFNFIEGMWQVWSEFQNGSLVSDEQVRLALSCFHLPEPERSKGGEIIQIGDSREITLFLHRSPMPEQPSANVMKVAAELQNCNPDGIAWRDMDTMIDRVANNPAFFPHLQDNGTRQLVATLVVFEAAKKKGGALVLFGGDDARAQHLALLASYYVGLPVLLPEFAGDVRFYPAASPSDATGPVGGERNNTVSMAQDDASWLLLENPIQRMLARRYGESFAENVRYILELMQTPELAGEKRKIDALLDSQLENRMTSLMRDEHAPEGGMNKLILHRRDLSPRQWLMHLTSGEEDVAQSVGSAVAGIRSLVGDSSFGTRSWHEQAAQYYLLLRSKAAMSQDPELEWIIEEDLAPDPSGLFYYLTNDALESPVFLRDKTKSPLGHRFIALADFLYEVYSGKDIERSDVTSQQWEVLFSNSEACQDSAVNLVRLYHRLLSNEDWHEMLEEALQDKGATNPFKSLLSTVENLRREDRLQSEWGLLIQEYVDHLAIPTTLSSLKCFEPHVYAHIVAQCEQSKTEDQRLGVLHALARLNRIRVYLGQHDESEIRTATAVLEHRASSSKIFDHDISGLRDEKGGKHKTPVFFEDLPLVLRVYPDLMAAVFKEEFGFGEAQLSELIREANPDWGDYLAPRIAWYCRGVDVAEHIVDLQEVFNRTKAEIQDRLRRLINQKQHPLLSAGILEEEVSNFGFALRWDKKREHKVWALVPRDLEGFMVRDKDGQYVLDPDQARVVADMTPILFDYEDIAPVARGVIHDLDNVDPDLWTAEDIKDMAGLERVGALRDSLLNLAVILPMAGVMTALGFPNQPWISAILLGLYVVSLALGTWRCENERVAFWTGSSGGHPDKVTLRVGSESLPQERNGTRVVSAPHRGHPEIVYYQAA